MSDGTKAFVTGAFGAAQEPAPPSITLIPIAGSSNIAAAGYDGAAKCMDLMFLSGATHRYTGVPQETYDDFLAAESKGRFFGSEIRGKYQSSRVDLPTQQLETAPAERPQDASPNNTGH
jgi:hypothetical protein